MASGARKVGTGAISVLGAAKPRLLDVLLLRADTPLHLRELARRSGVALGQVKRELTMLVDDGLLVQRRAGGRVLYEPDQANPALAPLRALLLADVGGLGVLLREALDATAVTAALFVEQDAAAELITFGGDPHAVLAAAAAIERRLGLRLMVTPLPTPPPDSDARRWLQRRAVAGTWIVGQNPI
jgi:hypothetical protein